MLRCLLSSLFSLLLFLFCVVADHAQAKCVSAPSSDGGSVCLPEGWRVKPWNDTADLGSEMAPGATLCDQIVFVATFQKDSKSSLSLVISRMGVALPSGELLPVSPYASRDLTAQVAAQCPREQIVSPPQEVRLGERTLWRFVEAEPEKDYFLARYRVFTNNASYEILIRFPAHDMSRLPSLELALINGWEPGNAPMRLPTAAAQKEWPVVFSPHLPGVRIALPDGWKIDLSGTLERDPLDHGSIQNRVIALEARGDGAERGRAWLEARIMWMTDAQGQPFTMPETTAMEFGDAILTGLCKRFAMTRTGTARESAGSLTPHLRFFILAQKLDKPLLGVVSAIIPGARRLVVLTLMHEETQAPYWRAFLVDMLRHWELTPEGAHNLLPMAPGS